MPSHPCRLADVPHWDGEADALIVGYGIAGACAALEASAAGAQCLLFEKAAGAGGSSALSGGEFYFGGNGGTPVQREHGYPDTTEDFYNYLMMAGGPGADAERVRLYAENALSHYEWLVAQGVPFKGTFHPARTAEPLTDDTLVWSGSESAWPFCEHARPAPRGHAVQKKGMGAGKVAMQKLVERIVTEPRISVHYNSRALALIVDTDHAVQGMVVRVDGTVRYYRARKGVVLCSGGFIDNEDMVRRYAPDALRVGIHVSGGQDDGSGIRMGISVGAAAIHMDQFLSTRAFVPPESLIRGIFINERGQRFINEDAYHGRIGQYIMRQPNGNAWLLVDNRIFERPVLNPGVEIAAVGETWTEIEEALGLPAGELLHTVENYNRHALAGTDPLFHKQAEWLQPLIEAPFAALAFGDQAWPAAGFTLGGLATRTTGQVINPDGAVIPGLYAAGRAACGLPRWGEGYSSGMSLADASYFGRLAGQHLATAS
ncbi:MAG: FAD-dependent oxidoreductase [Sterolibacterium sp.]|jgi:3-oxo-5alpha-steroid 4-dehydrogenase|nr:FAD-dependent oxidoreductase [Sterolibacterium sp.]